MAQLLIFSLHTCNIRETNVEKNTTFWLHVSGRTGKTKQWQLAPGLPRCLWYSTQMWECPGKPSVLPDSQAMHSLRYSKDHVSGNEQLWQEKSLRCLADISENLSHLWITGRLTWSSLGHSGEWTYQYYALGRTSAYSAPTNTVPISPFT